MPIRRASDGSPLDSETVLAHVSPALLEHLRATHSFKELVTRNAGEDILAVFTEANRLSSKELKKRKFKLAHVTGQLVIYQMDMAWRILWRLSEGVLEVTFGEWNVERDLPNLSWNDPFYEELAQNLTGNHSGRVNHRIRVPTAPNEPVRG